MRSLECTFTVVFKKFVVYVWDISFWCDVLSLEFLGVSWYDGFRVHLSFFLVEYDNSAGTGRWRFDFLGILGLVRYLRKQP